MAIENYRELTRTLIDDWLKSLFTPESDNAYSPVNASSSEKNYQWSLQPADGDIVLTINVSELSPPHLILVNLVYPQHSSKIENVLIDWSNSGIIPKSLQFPIDSSQIDTQTSSNFDQLVSTKVDVELLKSLFRSENRTSKFPPRQAKQTPAQQGFDPASSLREPPTTIGPTASEEPARRRIPDMPDFEDELEIQRPMNPITTPQSSGFPSIGDRDLNPPRISRNPDLRSFIPHSGEPDGGGMYPTPDHPLFGQRGPGGTSSRLGVPPGARYDDPLSEDNLDALGSGLPGGLRNGRGSSSRGGPSGFPGFPGGSNGPGGFGNQFGGSGGGGFGGGFGF